MVNHTTTAGIVSGSAMELTDGVAKTLLLHTVAMTSVRSWPRPYSLGVHSRGVDFAHGRLAE